MKFLRNVIQTKKVELMALKEKEPLSTLKQKCVELMAKIGNNPRQSESAIHTLIRDSKPICLIAEIKLHSPAEGKLTNLNITELSRLYAQSKADIISVLTDKKYFKGNLTYIQQVKKIASQPVLRKDFIIDAYQIYETFLASADMFLLIAAVLTNEQLKEYIHLGKILGLTALVEIHNEADLQKALSADADIIGINNRDLDTLNINLNTTLTLLPRIPLGKIVISESGICNAQDINMLVAAGVRGVLVGSSILKSKNVMRKIDEFKLAA